MKKVTTTTTEEFDKDGALLSRTTETITEEDDNPIQQWPPYRDLYRGFEPGMPGGAIYTRGG